MLQRCSCPYSWTGTGCELEVQQCDMNSLTCPNGKPCAVNENGSHHCDCAVADMLSTFASQQCRRPYTEYCSASYDSIKPLSFCTNGGVCRGSVMAAKAAPGNTSVNDLYEHEGCICPREYYGPHCEFIHRSLPPISNEQAQVEAPKNPPQAIPASQSDPNDLKNGKSKTIKDLIRDYSEFGGNENAGTSNVENSGSSLRNGTLMKYLIGLLAFIVLGFVFVGFKVMRYRRSRNQGAKKGNRKRPKAGKKSKSSSSVSTQETEPVSVPITNPNVKKPKTKKDKMHKKKDSNLPIHQEGTADLSPFAIDGEEDEDEQTLATWDSSSHHQEVMAHSNEASGGWVAAISQHIDTYVGTRYQQAQDYIVDDDDVVSDIYSVNTDSQHPYMIDQDESSLQQQDDAYLVVDDDYDDDGCLYYHRQTRQQAQMTHQASLWGDSWD